MKHHSKHQPLRYLFIVLITISIFSLFYISDVQADAAPPGPPSGVNLFPPETGTNVRMVSETVIYEIMSSTPYDKANARVNATFNMRNLGDVEEKMDVRFPLDMSRDFIGVCMYSTYLRFPLINDLAVTVDGKLVDLTYENKLMDVHPETDTNSKESVPCWAKFPVTFPVGKDVVIQTTYTVAPFNFYWFGYEYGYVVFTGNGWKDTIGSGDFIFNVPYELNEYNFPGCGYKNCKVSKNKVEIHFENFTATDVWRVSLSLVPPPLWRTIQAETKNVEQNPNDGEAWGRLGKAYKESIQSRRSYYLHNNGASFKKSKEAYQKAISLLPDDADWHYGYAGLLCWDAEWDNLGKQFLNSDSWPECLDQVREVFRINPMHEKMRDYVQNNNLFDGTVDVFVDHTEFLSPAETQFALLTQTPTPSLPNYQPKPTNTPTVSQ